MRPAERLDAHAEQDGLPADFADRLEVLLQSADQERRRRLTIRRAKRVVGVLLLLGPIVAWRLMLATPDGVHVGIAALAWIAFVLDVGVHVDTVFLAYLHLQALPSLVGLLLLVLVVGWLLGTSQTRER